VHGVDLLVRREATVDQPLPGPEARAFDDPKFCS
jgi:hypothetical protein